MKPPGTTPAPRAPGPGGRARSGDGGSEPAALSASTPPARARPAVVSGRHPRAETAGEAGAASSVLERVLAHPGAEPRAGAMREAEVVAWTEAAGTLADGRPARLGASCLLRPAAGDRVVVWAGESGERWVLGVLERPGESPAKVLATSGPLTIQAPRVVLAAGAVHIHAEDFLTSTRNRHAVEHTRTETVQVRVAQVGTDVRRAVNVSDDVEGTVLQRAGTWISNTVREARLHARAFLFD